MATAVRESDSVMNFSVPDPSGICVVLGKKKEKVDMLLLLLPGCCCRAGDDDVMGIPACTHSLTVGIPWNPTAAERQKLQRLNHNKPKKK